MGGGGGAGGETGALSISQDIPLRMLIMGHTFARRSTVNVRGVSRILKR